MGYATQLDIINLGLQKLGRPRISNLSDFSAQAQEANFSYDKMRRAELMRNPWTFSIRRVALRPLDQYMQKPTFVAWASGTTYGQNEIITGSDSQVYISLQASNTGNDPTLTTNNAWWTLYFGPLIVTPFPSTWSGTPTYNLYDIVTGSDANYYRSAIGSNHNNQPVGDNGTHWTLLSTTAATGILQAYNDFGLSFYAGELVFAAGAIYQSLVNGNQNDPTTDTTGSWNTLTPAPTLALFNFIYPVGAGPSTQTFTRNVFILPSGFLRHVPQAPKDGFNAFLGGPSLQRSDDWLFENGVLTSFQPEPMLLRFAADVSDPSQFHAMFADGLGCRCAIQWANQLDKAEKALIPLVRQDYKKFMSEARAVDGIESGPVDFPLDEYLAVRV